MAQKKIATAHQAFTIHPTIEPVSLLVSLSALVIANFALNATTEVILRVGLGQLINAIALNTTSAQITKLLELWELL
jgi:hypothetical protein